METPRPKSVESYSGDDAQQLASEIEKALQLYSRGGDRRLLTAIEFFEGELRLIAQALRDYAPGKSAKSGP